jgi:hypothetical protein
MQAHDTVSLSKLPLTSLIFAIREAIVVRGLYT